MSGVGVFEGPARLRFEDYRVGVVFQGLSHSLDRSLLQGDKWSGSRLDAMRQKVNFAGHYIVHAGDCGGGAVCGEILDAETGKVVSGFPNAYVLDSSDGSYYDAHFRPDSRLLIISGVAADPEFDDGGRVLPATNRVRYFEFKGGELFLIKIEDF